MKAFRYRRTAKYRLAAIKVVLLVLIPLFLPPTANAADPAQENGAQAGSEQIQILADKLITNNEQKFAEFIGDVHASQGSVVIISERLRVYYRDDGDPQAGRRESIKQIVASGNVRISTEQYTAETDRVEYDLQRQIIVLVGKNSAIKSGKNILTGSKITVDRKNGQIKIDSSPQKRVKAVFYPDETAEKDR